MALLSAQVQRGCRENPSKAFLSSSFELLLQRIESIPSQMVEADGQRLA